MKFSVLFFRNCEDMIQKLSKTNNELRDREKQNTELSQSLHESREREKDASGKLHDSILKYGAAQNLIKVKDDELMKLQTELKIQAQLVRQNENGSFKDLDELAADNENKNILIALLTDNMNTLERLLEESQQEVVKVQKERSSIFEHSQKLTVQLQMKGVDVFENENILVQKLNDAQNKLQGSIEDNKQLAMVVNVLQT